MSARDFVISLAQIHAGPARTLITKEEHNRDSDIRRVYSTLHLEIERQCVSIDYTRAEPKKQGGNDLARHEV